MSDEVLESNMVDFWKGEKTDLSKKSSRVHLSPVSVSTRTAKRQLLALRVWFRSHDRFLVGTLPEQRRGRLEKGN